MSQNYARGHFCLALYLSSTHFFLRLSRKHKLQETCIKFGAHHPHIETMRPYFHTHSQPVCLSRMLMCAAHLPRGEGGTATLVLREERAE